MQGTVRCAYTPNPSRQPSGAFRQRWQYQNLIFMTARVLAERITGQTWEELVRRRIFVPLSIGRHYGVEADDVPRRASAIVPLVAAIETWARYIEGFSQILIVIGCGYHGGLA